MSNSHTFKGVTPEVLQRLSDSNDGDYTIQISGNDRSGSASISSSFGRIDLRFDYAPQDEAVTLHIVKKPMMVPAPLLWSQLSLALRNAQAR